MGFLENYYFFGYIETNKKGKAIFSVTGKISSLNSIHSCFSCFRSISECTNPSHCLYSALTHVLYFSTDGSATPPQCSGQEWAVGKISFLCEIF